MKKLLIRSIFVGMSACLFTPSMGKGALLFARENPEKSENFLERPTPEIEVAETDPVPLNRGLLADHYPASNEMRIDLFEPRLKDLGGGYLGVGTDQNFTFIAWARSQYAYLMDFDPVVVNINKIHLYFISIAPTYDEFRKLWVPQPSERKKIAAMVQEHFKNQPDAKAIVGAYRIAVRGWNDVPSRLKELDRMGQSFGFHSFQNRPEDYRYIRNLVLTGHIQALNGDLTGTKTIQNISRKATEMETPIRVLYMSNAEEYFQNPPAFRKNILSLPADEKSLVVRTMTSGTRAIFGFPDGEKYPDDYPFHYNLQPLEGFKEWMRWPGNFKTFWMLKFRKPLEKGLSIMERIPDDEIEKRATVELGFQRGVH